MRVNAAGGQPLQTEALRYGLRVSVVGFPAHLMLRTPEALEVVGPAAFGYPDIAYEPLGPYREVQPVPGKRRDSVGEGTLNVTA